VLADGWQLLIGLPSAADDGWGALATAIGLPGGLGVLAPAVLLAPLAAIALLAIFLPGSRRAIPAMVVALLGLITAVASAQLAIATDGAELVTPWPGTGLSLYWLGLVGAAVVAVDALGSARVVVGIAVLLTAGAAVAPLLAAPVLGTSAVATSDARLLPALVTAEAAAHPGVGTLLRELSLGARVGAPGQPVEPAQAGHRVGRSRRGRHAAAGQQCGHDREDRQPMSRLEHALFNTR
jgi:hypothetical protein